MSPSVVSFNIKYSKTDPGRHGYQVVLGNTNDDLCPVAALPTYLGQRGDKPEHYFSGGMVLLYPRQNLWRLSVKPCQPLTFQPKTMLATALELGQQPLQQWLGYRIQQFKHWVGGRVHHISYISIWIPGNWPHFHHHCQAVTYDWLCLLVCIAV